MCTAECHTFIYSCASAWAPIPVGHYCVCGRERWGSAEQLAALDEIAQLDMMLALPWPERTRCP